MKFLADENVEAPTVKILRTQGLDIKYILETHPGTDDASVLRLARVEKRILITFDRDYGELIFKHQHPVPLGIIYFRGDFLYPDKPGLLLLDLLASNVIDWYGRMTVITDQGKTRQKIFPITL